MCERVHYPREKLLKSLITYESTGQDRRCSTEIFHCLCDNDTLAQRWMVGSGRSMVEEYDLIHFAMVKT